MFYANPFAYMIGILAKEGYNHVLCKVELKCKYQCFAVIVGDLCVFSMQYMPNDYAMTCFSEPYMVKWLYWCSSATEYLFLGIKKLIIAVFLTENLEKKIFLKIDLNFSITSPINDYWRL